MFRDLAEWITEHLGFFGLPAWLWAIVISVTLAAISIAITVVALIHIPADYFVGSHRPESVRRHPVVYWTKALGRNLFGWLLIVFGIVLSFPGIPGQGLLTILLGLMLVDFPGKRRLEQRFVRWPRVRRPIDKLRRKFGRAPLHQDDE